MITRSRSRSGSLEATPVAEDSQCSSQSVSDSAPLEEIEPRPRLKKRKSSQGSRRGRGLTRKQDQWVCLMPSSFLSSSAEEQEKSTSIVSLKNPSSNNGSKYLLKEDVGHCELCEILNISSDEPRSWFLGNTVQTDGGLRMCVPVDPLFLALPYFQAASKHNKFTTLDAILEDDKFETFRILSKCVPKVQWSNISERKGVGDITVYRYSKQRALTWLGKKVSALARALEEEGVYVGKGSQSSMLVRSQKNTEVSKADYENFACGMVGDYLASDLFQDISAAYSASSNGSLEKPAEQNGDELQEPPAKRPRPNKPEPLEDYSHYWQATVPQQATSQTLKQTAAQKSLAKIDKTGIKKLSSFFKKKPTET